MEKTLPTVGKRLVIDTCVCRSAGGKSSKDMLSKKCFEILDCVYEMDYYFVCTPEIKKEINKDVLNEEPDKKGRKPISYTATMWFSRMVSSRRIYTPEESKLDKSMRREIEKIDIKKSTKKDILKDMHLVEAAIAADYRIISKDTNAYSNLRIVVNKFDKMKVVIWMDVNDPENDTVVWLRTHAKDLKKNRLGYNISNN